MGSYKTTLFYVLPKERIANLVQQKDPGYKVRSGQNGELICDWAGEKIVLSDYPIRERIYAGPTMGFVQGIVGTRADLDCTGQFYFDKTQRVLSGSVDSDFLV